MRLLNKPITTIQWDELTGWRVHTDWVPMSWAEALWGFALPTVLLALMLLWPLLKG